MQHDVDYSSCAFHKQKYGKNENGKNVTGRKMVKSLDSIAWNKRQWGHALARNVLNSKQNLAWVTIIKRDTKVQINIWTCQSLFAYYKNMIVSFHFIALLVNEYFTPEWQKNVRDITREVVVSMLEAD